MFDLTPRRFAHLTECPRDAMQGIKNFIPTKQKIAYLNLLLKVGFDVLDFGSFVSPKAIPQMADTSQIINQLEPNARTQLLAIVANDRGAREALAFENIDFLGFPFSISDTFQQRNTNKNRQESLATVSEIHKLCSQKNRHLRIYISMGFGNPYGDVYNEDVVFFWVDKLVSMGIKNLYFADTVGLSNPASIDLLYQKVVPHFKNIDFGIHLHSTKADADQKIEASLTNGCMLFDSALLGIGGCPMATDQLTGNIATERLVEKLKEKNFLQPHFDLIALQESIKMARDLFATYH